MHNVKKLILIFSLILSQVSLATADTTDAFQFFQEEAKFVTASLREQSINEAPWDIDAVTAEDIKASGAVNLWDRRTDTKETARPGGNNEIFH